MHMCVLSVPQPPSGINCFIEWVCVEAAKLTALWTCWRSPGGCTISYSLYMWPVTFNLDVLASRLSTFACSWDTRIQALCLVYPLLTDRWTLFIYRQNNTPCSYIQPENPLSDIWFTNFCRAFKFAYLIKISFHMLSMACCFSDYAASWGELLFGRLETASQVTLQALNSSHSQAGGGWTDGELLRKNGLQSQNSC